MLPQDTDKSDSPRHFLQFYDRDASALAASVARYTEEGLNRGEGVILIAGDAHRDAFLQCLSGQGVDTQTAIRDQHLVCQDAERTLAQFMVDGQPDWPRFQSFLETLIGELKPRRQAGLRAYGEMVDVLWNAGHSAAAIRLEHFWNRLMAKHEFNLFCAYQIDVFGKEFQGSVLGSVLRAHTHLVPDGHGKRLDQALNRALDDALGASAEGVRDHLNDPANSRFDPSWAAIPKAEATVLWLRNNLPNYADEILTRARGYYHAATN